MDKRIDTYINNIVAEIDCGKDEKEEMAEEMRDHLILLTNEYKEAGHTKKEAVQKALESFGECKKIRDQLQTSISPFHKLFRWALWTSFASYLFLMLVELLFNRLYRNANSDYNEYLTLLAHHKDSPFIIFNSEVFSLNTNFIPFGNIYMYLTGFDSFNSDIIWSNMFGNILIFIPIGLFVSLLFAKKIAYFKGIAFFFSLSLIIETSQYLLRVGQFDIDDIILHVAGGIVGSITGHFLRETVFSSRRRPAQLGMNK
ncbi:VanZ family protein [Domibacillus enclensis]|uniref:VanZ family protein n=1 Tax=Domibacillus enclensis TaxID=1017273 RepID=A0A1N6XZI5_9BACI|nr:VanZ family protein [Domibacillus enclensis]OXS77467.1 VanZ family protein [Domibacillus enclensis]SIR07738.1 VanZ like family protein [Domibacillus enclensis]